MSIHCFYHSVDLDGHCSGAIVKYRFPEAIMHPINYGDEFPYDHVDPGDTVYMVDFCLQPDEKMKELHNYLHEGRGEFFWVDHHKSQQLLTTQLKHWQGYFTTRCAACELTWEYLFPDKPIPLAVKLLSLYDSWTYEGHELEPMVLPFQMRMRMERLDPRDWDDCRDKWIGLFEIGNLSYEDASGDLMFGPSVDDLVREGKLLLRYDEEQKRRYVQTYGFETMLKVNTIDSARPLPTRLYKAIALNIGMSNSKVFDSVWRKECAWCHGKPILATDKLLSMACGTCGGKGYLEPYDLMITFCRRTDHKWNVSLYSTKPDIDCGAIAKSFGGGGHKGAAGFQCVDLPFEY